MCHLVLSDAYADLVYELEARVRPPELERYAKLGELCQTLY